MKDRNTGQVAAQVVNDTTAPTLTGVVSERLAAGAEEFTDEARAYPASGFDGLPAQLGGLLARVVGGRHGARLRRGELLVVAQARLSQHLSPHWP